jgi:HK97 family phage portal protein
VGIFARMSVRSNALENPHTPIGDGIRTWYDVFGSGGPTNAGTRVNEASALTLAAVYAATQTISADIGSMPIKVYQHGSGDTRAEVRTHPLWDVLRNAPNPEMSAIAYREAGTGHQLLHGNKYSEIIRNGRGQVAELWAIAPGRVEPRRVEGVLHYLVDGANLVPADRILNVPGLGSDGIIGWSVLQNARESLGLSLATDEYGARFFSNGSRPAGILTTPENLSKEAAKKLKARWQAAQGGGSNAHRVAVLEDGVTWQQIGLSAEDSQFLDTRQFQVREVARFFNIAPHLIGDMSDATFSNIEEQSIDHMRRTLNPWLVRDEQAMNRQLLTSAERADGLFVEYVREGILRGDVAKRGDWYMTRMQTGSMTPNEIRAKENQNPLPGGDEAWMPVNMIPVSVAAEMSTEQRLALIAAEHGVGLNGGMMVRPEYADDEHRRLVERAQTYERRDHTQRMGLRSSFAPLFLDTSNRMVRGELRNVRRANERMDAGAFAAWLDDYYFNDHPTFMRSLWSPVFRSYGEAVASAAADEIGGEAPDVSEFVEMHTETFTARYSASSRMQLKGIVRESEEVRADVETRLTEWDEGNGKLTRAEQYAQSEPVQIGNGIAKLVFSLAGFAAIWRTVGDSCPYCVGLNGKTASGAESFINEGQEFQPDGADAPLVPKRNVGYPPAHKGCNCTVTHQ